MKEKILVSACLLGTPCRYDGRSKPCDAVVALSKDYDLIPVCPEQLGGLSTQRLPCELSGDRVIRCDGADATSFYEEGAKRTLDIAKKNGCRIAILKEKSPSCSPHFHYDGTFSKTLTEGMGLTAKILSQNGIRILGENETDLL